MFYDITPSSRLMCSLMKIVGVCCLTTCKDFLEVLQADCGSPLSQVMVNPYTCTHKCRRFLHYHSVHHCHTVANAILVLLIVTITWW